MRAGSARRLPFAGAVSALGLSLVACAPSAAPLVHRAPPVSYRFVPPAHARACPPTSPGATSSASTPGEPGCARYRDRVARSGPGAATIADLDALRDLCAEGVLDACDHGLLLVAICSEAEVPVEPACVHLAQHGALPPPEPTWRDVALPAAWVGCFELMPAEGPHSSLFAPGGVICLSADGVLAVRPPAPPPGTIDGASDEVDALRVRPLGLRRVVRDGLHVRELPLEEIELVVRDPGAGATAVASDASGSASILPVLATLLAGARVKTAYATVPARRLRPDELARMAPGLDRVPLEETCVRARRCLERAHAEQVAHGEASGTGWDGAPPEVPSSLRACAAAAATCGP